MGENKESTVAMQKSRRWQEMKPFRELNLADDFMFHVVADDLECCKIILGKH